MRRRTHATCSLIGIALLAALVGCDSASDVLDADDLVADVEAGADAVGLAGPSADASADMIGDMLGLLAPAQAAAGARTVGSACPAPAFELPSGVAGTCTASETGTVTFMFDGTIVVAGGSATVAGTFVATPTVAPAGAAAAWLVDYDATATGTRGVSTWSVIGTIVLDDAGAVSDFDLTMTHTFSPTDGPTVQVTVVLGPTRFELVLTGPRGGVLRFVLDREAMSGSVSVNGRTVADVSIEGACATIDFFDASFDDRTICAEG